MIECQRAQIESMEFYHEVPVVFNLRTGRGGTVGPPPR